MTRQAVAVSRRDARRWLTYGLAICLLAGCGGRLPMIGWGRGRRPVVAELREKEYIARLSEALVSAERSVVPALETASRDGEEGWKLRAATLGFNVKAEAGIGPFEFFLQPRIRMTLSSLSTPPQRSADQAVAPCAKLEKVAP